MSIITTKTQTVGKPFNVLFGYNPLYAVKAMLSVVKAYDPLLPKSPLARLATADAFKDIFAEVSSAMTNTASFGMQKGLREGEQKPGHPLADKGWALVLEGLASGLLLMEEPVRLSQMTTGAGADEKLTTMIDRILSANGSFEPLPSRGGPDQLLAYTSYKAASTPLIEDTIRLLMTLDWPKVLAAKFLINVPEAPNAATSEARATHVRLTRALRLAALYYAYKMSFKVAKLRPFARLLAIDEVRVRAVAEWGVNGQQMYDLIQKVASEPIHPWLALADSPGQPGRALTPWSHSSPVVGMPKDVFDAISADVRGRNGADAGGVGDLNPLLTSAFKFAKSLHADFVSLRAYEDLSFDAAVAALKFTSSIARPNIGLYGEEIIPLHSDGLNVSDSSVTMIDLLSRPLLVVATPDGRTPWIGSFRTITYQGDIVSPGGYTTEHRPTIYIEPHQPMLTEEYSLNRISPDMLKPWADYQGEVGFVRFPATVEGIANFVGYSASDLVAKAALDKDVWAQMVKPIGKDGTIIDWSRPASERHGYVLVNSKGTQYEGDVYYAETTRKPWMRSLELSAPTDFLAEELLTLQAGHVASVQRRNAQYVVNPDVPIADWPLSEKLEEWARNFLSL